VRAGATVITHALVLTIAGFTIGLVDTAAPSRVHIQGPALRVFPGLPAPTPPALDAPCLVAELTDVDTIARLRPAVCTVAPLASP